MHIDFKGTRKHNIKKVLMHFNSNPHTYIQIPHQHFHKSADKSMPSAFFEKFLKFSKKCSIVPWLP